MALPFQSFGMDASLLAGLALLRSPTRAKNATDKIVLRAAALPTPGPGAG